MHGTAEHMPKLVPLLCIASSCLCVPACYPDCPCIAKCSIYRCMYVPLTTIVYVDYRRNRVFYVPIPTSRIRSRDRTRTESCRPPLRRQHATRFPPTQSRLH